MSNKSKQDKTIKFIRTAKKLLKFNEDTKYGILLYKINGKTFTKSQLEDIVHRHLVDLGVRKSWYEMARELFIKGRGISQPSVLDFPLIEDIQNGFTKKDAK
jgi:hypothetical protein